MNVQGRRKLPSYLDPRFTLIVAVVSFFVAFMSAIALWGEVRLVDLLILFFGGFGAGAGVAAAAVRYHIQMLAQRRKALREEQEGSMRVRRGNP